MRSGRRLRAIGLLVAAAITAAACSSAEPEALALSDETQVDETTRLRVATTDAAGLLVGIAEWERSHPTVTVELDVRTTGDLLQALLSDDTTPPDVVALNPRLRIAALDSPTRFLDLDAAIEPSLLEPKLDDVVEAGVAGNRALIGVPLSSDAIALAVRTDLLGEDHLENVRAAETWCDLLAAADEFSAETNIAFLGDPTEFARGQFAQSRAAYSDRISGLIVDDQAELEAIWDLAMSSLGENTIHADACSDQGDTGRISRNFTFGDPLWAGAASADGFAASVISFRDLAELAAAVPDTAGLWEVLPAPGSTGASDGLVHLAVPAASEHHDLAIDLVATLASTQMEELTFVEGTPTLPVSESFVDSDLTRSELQDFFGAGVIRPFADAVQNRPSDVGVSAERQVTIDLVINGIRDVASDARSPRDAWDEIVDRLG